jgi:hypothetical protein
MWITPAADPGWQFPAVPASPDDVVVHARGRPSFSLRVTSRFSKDHVVAVSVHDATRTVVVVVDYFGRRDS